MIWIKPPPMPTPTDSDGKKKSKAGGKSARPAGAGAGAGAGAAPTYLEYGDGIAALRNIVNANTTGKIEKIDLIFGSNQNQPAPGDPPNITLYTNLSLKEINGAGALYTIGFENKVSGTWAFNGQAGNIPNTPPITTPKGDYVGLNGIPEQILYSTFKSTFASISAFKSGFHNQSGSLIKQLDQDPGGQDMAILIIAISEAIRFEEVKMGIHRILLGAGKFKVNSGPDQNTYTPAAITLNNWDRLGKKTGMINTPHFLHEKNSLDAVITFITFSLENKGRNLSQKTLALAYRTSFFATDNSAPPILRILANTLKRNLTFPTPDPIKNTELTPFITESSEDSISSTFSAINSSIALINKALDVAKAVKNQDITRPAILATQKVILAAKTFLQVQIDPFNGAESEIAEAVADAGKSDVPVPELAAAITKAENAVAKIDQNDTFKGKDTYAPAGPINHTIQAASEAVIASIIALNTIESAEAKNKTDPKIKTALITATENYCASTQAATMVALNLINESIGKSITGTAVNIADSPFIKEEQSLDKQPRYEALKTTFVYAKSIIDLAKPVTPAANPDPSDADGAGAGGGGGEGGGDADDPSPSSQGDGGAQKGGGTGADGKSTAQGAGAGSGDGEPNDRNLPTSDKGSNTAAPGTSSSPLTRQQMAELISGKANDIQGAISTGADWRQWLRIELLKAVAQKGMEGHVDVNYGLVGAVRTLDLLLCKAPHFYGIELILETYPADPFIAQPMRHAIIDNMQKIRQFYVLLNAPGDVAFSRWIIAVAYTQAAKAVLRELGGEQHNAFLSEVGEIACLVLEVY